MKLDIRDNIPNELALELVLEVVKGGRVSKNDTLYCYATEFDTELGSIVVETRDNRKSDCFVIYKL